MHILQILADLAETLISYMEAQAMAAHMLEAFEFSIPAEKPSIVVRTSKSLGAFSGSHRLR